MVELVTGAMDEAEGWRGGGGGGGGESTDTE